MVTLDNSKVYVQSWSGGKDSTASIVLEHMHRERLGIPPSKVVMAEVMFDNERGITGEYPDHMEWVYTKAKPLLESWGHEVVIKRSEKDYISLFRHVVQNSKKADRNGKKSGFPLGGSCVIQRDLKLKTIRQIRKEFIREDTVEFIGIAADEKKRLARLSDMKISLLDRLGVIEEETYDIVKPFGLLSPSYAHTRRGGCWFCMNQSHKDFAWLKKHYPEYWGYLRELAEEGGTISQYFKYDETFFDVDLKVTTILLAQERQYTMF